MAWITLPARVQYLIFRHMEHVGDRLAPTAVVSRQWQTLAEERIFERMSITQYDLPHFASVVNPRRHLVKAIWFRIELREYDCRFCRSNESPREPVLPFKYLLWLFQDLSSWEPGLCVALDISVYSPSDSQHALKYATIEPDLGVAPLNTPLNTREVHQTIARREAVRAQADRHRFHVNGHEREAERSISKLFGTVDWFGDWVTADLENTAVTCHLPDVPAVQVFQLRLQNRRAWWPSVVEAILSHLPRLRKFHFEPWRQWADSDQTYFDREYVALFRSLCLKGLSDIVIFENSNGQYPTRINPFYPSSSVRLAGPDVTRAIWKASQFASLVCASFIADARYFFNFTPTATAIPRWPNLQKLVLTTRLFTPPGNPNAIDKMLMEAARALAYMPNLREFQLWNGDVGLAALFHFSLTRLGCFITWKSTWDFQLSPLALTVWEQRAMAACGQEPIIRHHLLDHSQIHSHGDAFVALEILPAALRPISLEQIRVESLAHRTNGGFWAAPVPPSRSVQAATAGGQRPNSIH